MPRHVSDVRFLHGPYHAPRLRKGDRATCLFRDVDVIVTGWSDGRIRWPRCRLLDTHGGRAPAKPQTLPRRRHFWPGKKGGSVARFLLL